jgi:hypothetical protein
MSDHESNNASDVVFFIVVFWRLTFFFFCLNDTYDSQNKPTKKTEPLCL